MMAFEHIGNKLELKDYLGKKVFNVLFLLLFVVPFLLQGQDSGINLNSPEKVYLQLSSKNYALNEPIWFKAIVTDAKIIRLQIKAGCCTSN